jgi:hypothetical protein
MQVSTFGEEAYLGVYGLSDYEAIAESLYNTTGDGAFKKPLWARITSLGLSQWNGNIVKVLSDNYKALKQQGNLKASSLALQSGISMDSAQAYMSLIQSGDVPKGVITKTTEAVGKPLQEGLDTVKIGLIAVSVIGGVYLLNQMGVFKNVKTQAQS